MLREVQEEICFNVTGRFEGRGYTQVTGNFDGAGWSLGFLQWNFGQGTAQRLLKEIHDSNPIVWREILGGAWADELSCVLLYAKAKAVDWANDRSFGTNKRRVSLDWNIKMAKLLDTVHSKRIQRKLAGAYMTDARNDCAFYKFRTVRGLALCFDISVQNGQGKAGPNGRANVAKAFGDRGGHALAYPLRLKALAEAVVSTANLKWQSDVLGRKMLIVNGSGVFRGRSWDMQKEFGLDDSEIV